MLRRGGKRIRMDEPPPEYDEPPMTPMTPAGSEIQEPHTPFTAYTPYASDTPLHHSEYQAGAYGQPTYEHEHQQLQQQHLQHQIQHQQQLLHHQLPPEQHQLSSPLAAPSVYPDYLQQQQQLQMRQLSPSHALHHQPQPDHHVPLSGPAAPEEQHSQHLHMAPSAEYAAPTASSAYDYPSQYAMDLVQKNSTNSDQQQSHEALEASESSQPSMVESEDAAPAAAPPLMADAVPEQQASATDSEAPANTSGTTIPGSEGDNVSVGGDPEDEGRGADGDDEDDDDDDDEDDDDEDDDDVPGGRKETPPQNYEPIPRLTISIRGQKKGRGRGKIAASIKKIGDVVVGSSSPPHAPPEPEQKRGRGRPSKKAPAGGAAEGGAAGGAFRASDEDSSLYAVVKSGRAALAQTVDDWIDHYKESRDAALLRLMQFFIDSAGCKGRITPTMQATMEHAEIIRRMTEEFEEESGEYPLIQTGQMWKKFRSNFCEFVQVLVKQCQYSIIYDQYLMDNVISLLTGLSDSQVRAFRHTATLAAMKLMTALVDVALTVSVNHDNTQRQYESERQKTREKRANDRLENLMTKRQELEENTDEIKNMLTYMFKSVFVHRYRDTLPEIRSICMAEIGLWMKKFHQNFLDDTYLKYIGWTLHDKVGDVRLKCLQALQPLYASEELKGKLELFTSKFKDRVVAMTLDKDYDVAVQAVRLVISILKYHRDILTDKDCEHVYELVYSSHRAVAQAAGEFLNERLFIPEDEAGEVTRTKRGKKRRPNTPLIRDLVQFFIESELHAHGAYLVDSLIDSNPMMKDWECMTDLLLEEPGPEEEPLDDRQETSLIELMVCCIKQAATGEPPVGRGSNRKMNMSAKELKQVNDDRARLTEHLIPTLPLMLNKFLADKEKVANLLLIPQYFDLEIYTTSRQEKNLDQLLKLIQDVGEKHSDTEVLETAAKTLEVLCNEDYAIYSRCDISRSSLLDMLANTYKEANSEYFYLIEGQETPDDDEIFALNSSVKKVSIFYSCHNMGVCNLWDCLAVNITRAVAGDKALPEEAAMYCISASFFAIMWELHTLEDQVEKKALNQEAVACLQQRLNSFIDSAKQLLADSDSKVLKEESYIVLCDLLIVFSSQLHNTSPSLASLVYESDRSIQHLLNDFIQSYVFIDDDVADPQQSDHAKIEELHKRRNFLATFCKLVVYNVLPTKVAADVFKHYVRYYDDYGDIIKATLGKTREINKVNCARTMALALTIIYKELSKDSPKINKQSTDFVSLKELAKRFALSFGLDAVKNREAITALHREGILFAVHPADSPSDPAAPPPNLPFLEILAEFTNKLLKQDKKVVQAYLERRISGGMPSSRSEDWQPLVVYRTSLLHGEGDQPHQQPRRAYHRKKKAGADDDDDDDDDMETFHHVEEAVRETGRPRRKRRLEQTIPDIIGRMIRHKWNIDGQSVHCTGTVLGMSAPGTVPEESEDGMEVSGTCYDVQYDDEDFVRHLILEGDWQRGDVQVLGRRSPPEEE
ncbi:cohesin subunit SA-2 isoform X1 [Hyalella azteca]|uniref:Cohesin subunit SA-2 isoform X1 n=1 Tax=Hyalella azteca TaxID=294128 RepID=A0A979FXW7_HYAAZ|nr:cohesin subunit SA-2 isoform X1 [Hyalella azteca]